MDVYTTYNDEQLIKLIKVNDHSAFKQLYDRYWKLLFSLAASKLDSFDEAEEIVQEIFTDLWARRESIQINRSVKYYLAAAAKYQVMTMLTKRHRKNQITIGLLSKDQPSAQPADQLLIFRQLQEELERIVSALPERCQLIYRLSREEGYSHKEIAQQLDISEKTVETQLTRALARIRTGLNDAALSLFFTLFL